MSDTQTTSEHARRVLELRRAGVAFDRIAAELDLPVERARELFAEALDAGERDHVNRLEADRLDRLLTAVWPQAMRGDLNAVDKALKISERRERLAAAIPPDARRLRAAYDESLATSEHTRDVDAALIEAGRTIADRVDAAIALGEGQEVTKALYLMPHMVNILRELLATPAARINAEPKPNPDGGKLAQLRALQGGKSPKRARA